LAPDIVKIVSRANAEEDNLRILTLIPHARRMGQEIISFCMGEKGRISRVLSLFLGAYMGFASPDKGEESAPGQFSLAEMTAVLSLLSGANREVRQSHFEQAGKERFGV
jgi:3-dehydroquinate dehydratase type I